MDSKNNSTEPPAPEVLKPQDDQTAESETSSAPAGQKPPKRRRRGTYRPSHKATFIGLIVVVAILAVNAGIIAFVLKSQSKSKSQADQGQVTINQSALEKLGVNRTPVGDKGVELTVNPNASFNGTVQVAGDVSIAGQLRLNNKFSAADASFNKLQAGDTTLSKLNVNGDGTLTNLNVRKDFTVAGTSRLQGPVTISQLLTATSINILGNLAVGGTLSAGNFHTSSLTVDSTLTIGGHVITRGSAPGVTPGSGLGQNGTVSISGNDASGTVAANIGVSASAGSLATVFFHSPYSTTPHVVVTPIGHVPDFYISRSSSGFTIYTGTALPPGGYAFDFIVEQ